MRYKKILAIFIFGFSLCQHSANAQQPFALSNDLRLQRTVSAEYLCTDLKSLCQLLSDKSLVIKAHKDCQEQKLQCRIIQRTKAETMRSLAEWLPSTWEKLPNNTGYQLIRTGKATKQKKEWWETFLRVREAAYKAQAARLLEEMRVPPEQRPVEMSGPEGVPSPAPDPALVRAVFNALPEAIRQKAVLDHVNYVDYHKELGAVFPHDPAPSFTIALPDSVRQVFSDHGKTLAPDTQMRLRYIGESVYVSFVSPEGQSVHASAIMDAPAQYALGFRAAINVGGDMVALAEAAGKDAPADWKQLAKWQKQTFWKPQTAPAKKREPTQAVSLFTSLTRAAALTNLTNSPRLQYIADYYSSPWLDENAPQARETPPQEKEWDAFAEQYDSSWKKSSDLFLIRNNRWYRDDELEVPHDLAQEWSKKREQRPSQTLINPQSTIELLREYARPLSLWQAANGLKWLSRREIAQTPKAWNALLAKETRTGPPALFMDSQYLIRTYSTLLFCNSLSTEALSSLYENRLPFDTLNAMQYEAVTRLVPKLQDRGENISVRIMLGLDMIGYVSPVPGIRCRYH